MMSMNCFLMKSSIAMWSPFALSGLRSCPPALALLAGGGKFLELHRSLRHLGFDPVERQCSGSERAILEHQRRRRVDVVLLAEQRGLREPSPFTFLIASSSGRESQAMRFIRFMRWSVRLVRVAVSYTDPTIT